MAYVNNGTERSLKVKVYKSVGGNYVQGYPKTYDGQLAFPGYSTLTDTEARQLSDGDFATRLADFESYVESVESGVDFDTDIVGYGATRANAACLEITTTTLAPVYAFSIRYGYLPVDACNGTAAIVYSNKSNPGVGDFLYKDPSLTQPWNTVAGSSVRFMSPKVHGDEVVGVAIVSGTQYGIGEIMLLTGFSCSGVITPTTSTTTIAPAVSTRVFLAQPIGSYTVDDFDGLTINGAISAGITDSGHIYQKYTNVTVAELQAHTPYGYTLYNDSACTSEYNGPEDYMAVIDTGLSSGTFEYKVYVNALGGTHLWVSL